MDTSSSSSLFRILAQDVESEHAQRTAQALELRVCPCDRTSEFNGLYICSACGRIVDRANDVWSEDSQPSASAILMQKASLGTNIQGCSHLSKINKWGLWMSE